MLLCRRVLFADRTLTYINMLWCFCIFSYHTAASIYLCTFLKYWNDKKKIREENVQSYLKFFEICRRSINSWRPALHTFRHTFYRPRNSFWFVSLRLSGCGHSFFIQKAIENTQNKFIHWMASTSQKWKPLSCHCHQTRIPIGCTTVHSAPSTEHSVSRPLQTGQRALS